MQHLPLQIKQISDHCECVFRDWGLHKEAYTKRLISQEPSAQHEGSMRIGPFLKVPTQFKSVLIQHSFVSMERMLGSLGSLCHLSGPFLLH